MVSGRSFCYAAPMKLARRLLGAWTRLVLIFFYLPIAILIGFSFNTSRLNIVWEGFTLRVVRARSGATRSWCARSTTA